MLESFENLNIDTRIIEGLAVEKITVPTAIQRKTIPLALENRDIIAQSETGTGKTLAYLLPLFEKLKVPKKMTEAIILVPTHELAIQIKRQIERLAQNSKLPVKSTALIGQVNMKRQIDKLKTKPSIIVGSAGRILALIKMKKLAAAVINTVILDEADRLLDVNNRDDVLAVINATSPERQLMFFSASITEDTIQKASAISNNPEVIRDDTVLEIPATIEHHYFMVRQQEKIETLRKIICILKPEKSLVFLNKGDQIENILSKLEYHGFKAGALHGALNKLERKMMMDHFRSGKINILIGSDIAARGLQVDGITHVFNMDIPEVPKEYLHRVGRTGRYNNTGLAISIITEREWPSLNVIQNSFQLKLSKKNMFNGEIVDH